MEVGIILVSCIMSRGRIVSVSGPLPLLISIRNIEDIRITQSTPSRPKLHSEPWTTMAFTWRFTQEKMISTKSLAWKICSGLGAFTTLLPSAGEHCNSQPASNWRVVYSNAFPPLHSLTVFFHALAFQKAEASNHCLARLIRLAISTNPTSSSSSSSSFSMIADA